MPFTYWCHAHQLCLWSILSVGLLQAHLDCVSLWGDCYADDYPYWLMALKPLFLHSTNIWSVVAVIAICRNLQVIAQAR